MKKHLLFIVLTGMALSCGNANSRTGKVSEPLYIETVKRSFQAGYFQGVEAGQDLTGCAYDMDELLSKYKSDSTDFFNLILQP